MDSFVPMAAAGLSAVVAGVVAWVVAKLGIRMEVAKLRIGTEQKLLEQLVAARLAAYPALYSLISRLPDRARSGTTNASRVREFLGQIDAWDAEYAILLGPKTTNVCYDFRQALRKAATSAESGDIPEASGQAILNAAEDLELALRSDLGIYGLKLAHQSDTLHMRRGRYSNG